MASEERSETGSALAVIGVALWLFDALVFFFFPAGVKTGHHAAFLAIIVILAVVGLVLIISGSRRRAR